MKRREFGDDWEDLFDEWIERFFSRRFGRGFADMGIFDEFGESFKTMEKRMNKLLKDASSGKIPSPEEGGPYVYGWSFRMGPDGKPEFQEFGNVTGALPGAPKEMIGSREPLVDVNETDDAVNVIAEVPGISKEDITLEMAENSLIINVDTKDRKYYKEIELPAEVDTDTAEAGYKNGVLEVKFGKAQPKKGKKLQIK